MLSLNKKVILKIIALFFITITIFNLNCLAIVDKTKEFYVNDYANLINTDTETYIINTNLNLYNQTGAQIVVVTVNDLEGRTIEEYATTLYRNFGIGSKEKNNGVLMLLALEEREFRIEVGYGLEGVLNDAKTGRIQDQYIIPYLKQNNWNEGIKNGYNAIIQIVAQEYGVSVNAEAPIITNSSSAEDTIGKYMPLIMIGLFFVIFFVAIKNGGTVSYGGGYHTGYHYPKSRRNYGNTTTTMNRTSGSRSSSRNTRISFGGGGSSGGRRKFKKILKIIKVEKCRKLIGVFLLF